MLTEISPYSEKVMSDSIDRSHAVGYRLALRDWFWCSGQAQQWFGPDDFYNCSGRLVTYVDTLPPRPNSCQKPVFLEEARFDAFAGCHWFSRGDLVRFLYLCCQGERLTLKQSPYDNLFLLEDKQIATVHWLPAYQLWQLHVTEDWPYQVNPGNRIFALL